MIKNPDDNIMEWLFDIFGRIYLFNNNNPNI